MFRIEMLPARQGDALLIEYGDDPLDPRRLLIDGGTPGTKGDLRSRIEGLDAGGRAFELLVITHVDGDHIGGILELLEEAPDLASFSDVWFNAWRHFPGNELEPLGPVQGERLTRWIEERNAPWNAAFGGAAVSVPGDGPLPAFDLAEDLRVTLLSPGAGELAALRPVWEQEVRKAGLEPGSPYEEPTAVPAGLETLGVPPTPEDVQTWAASEFEPDGSEANGTSISLLLERGGRSALLTGDAHSEPLVRGIRRMLEARGIDRLEVDVLKLPHHGSRHNVSAELLGLVRADAYLFSTNGAQYGHPDREAVARVVVAGEATRLCFNYRDRVGDWSGTTLASELGYTVEVPADEDGRLSIDL